MRRLLTSAAAVVMASSTAVRRQILPFTRYQVQVELELDMCRQAKTTR